MSVEIEDPTFVALHRYTKALSVALGHRDLYTRIHSERVVGLSLAMGKELFRWGGRTLDRWTFGRLSSPRTNSDLLRLQLFPEGASRMARLTAQSCTRKSQRVDTRK